MRGLRLGLSMVVLVCSAAALAQFVRVGGGSRAGGATAPLPNSFIWYGDSIVQGAGSPIAPPAKLESLLTGYVGFNAGISNETAAQIAARYFAAENGENERTDCNGEECGTYLFEGGANDCKGGACTPSAVLATMLTMVDDCRARGRRCIWSNIMPFRGCAFCGDTAEGWAKAKEYNNLWSQACAARPQVRCVDVGAGTAFEEPDTDGFLLEAFSFDGIHLKQAGTDAYAAAAANLF